MHKAHLFFPENDLALASNLANYTPPRMARALHLSGETLPMWYGDEGDVFLCGGVNDRWFTSMCNAFNLQTDVYPHKPDGFWPCPWGWSLASRREFVFAGFTLDQLPSDSDIWAIRMLSHRRSSVIISNAMADALPDRLFTPVPIEVKDRTEALEAIQNFGGDAVIKSPWSNAGRGVAFTRGFSEESLAQRIDDTISAYASLLIEPRLDKILDFAMLFEAHEDGNVTYTGLSLFEADERGAYTRNIVADDNILAQKISEYIPREDLSALSQALLPILSESLGGRYRGLLGIDMLVAENKDDAGRRYIIDPCVELNLRNTMGHVAHVLAERVLAPGITASFTTVRNSNYNSPIIANPLEGLYISENRLYKGVLTLNPLTSPFLFTLSV